jgi:hypothetical protein
VPAETNVGNDLERRGKTYFESLGRAARKVLGEKATKSQMEGRVREKRKEKGERKKKNSHPLL